MNKIKIIINILLSFIISLLITFLSILIIFKISILNKNYVFKKLDNYNYYEKVSNNIRNNMENYMVSSGLPEDVLNDIYDNEKVTNDIKLFINNIYEGKETKIDTNNLVEKLDSNINNYLNNHNLKVTSNNSLELFKQDIANIYQKEVTLYNLINGFIKYFAKLNNIIKIVIPILVISIIILSLINIFINKSKYFGSIIIASGINILLLKIIVIDKIDIQNILIISNEFSDIVRELFLNISSDIIFLGIVLIIIGLIVNIFLLRKDK